MHAIPTVMIECDNDKENLPNEADYEDLPGMYKDEDEEEDEEEEDEEEEEEDEEDDTLFTSRCLSFSLVCLYCGCLWKHLPTYFNFELSTRRQNLNTNRLPVAINDEMRA